MTIQQLVCSAAIAALATPAVAHADDALDDFVFEVKEYTGDYNRAWVIKKLVNFKVGKKCLAKLSDKDNRALHTASFYTRDIAEYAKLVTGDDWDSIESQNNNDRENNKKLIEPMMDAFKSKHSLTINVEGDDCNAKDGLWMKYWHSVGSALKSYPPKGGKAFITLNVTSKAKDVTATVDKTGTVFTITAPRDIEVTQWDDKLTKPFRKVAKSP